MALMKGRLLCVICLISVIHLSIANDVLPKGLKCISCNGRLSLLDCNEIEVCSHDDEICYVEEVLDKGGEVVINAGCRKQAICDSKGCFNATTRSRRDIMERAKRSNTGEQICHHCCDTELCNMFGCSETNEIDSLKYRRCVVCNLIDHPKHCHVIKTCDPGEYCYTSLKVRSTGVGTVKRYDTGCMKQKVCDLLEETHQHQRTADRKRRSYVELYSECCKSHMCNRNIPLDSDLPSRISQAYKCPKRNDAPGLTSSQPVIQEVCEDKIDNCAVYGEDYICHGDYIPWAKLNCNKFCKFCKPCEDAIAECPLYGKDYICKGDYIPWSMINCRKFCNLCNVPVTTTTTTLVTTTKPVPCEDVIDNCAVYGESYICHGDYIPWAEINCRKFCNFCSVPMKTTTTSTTTEAITTTMTPLPTTTKQEKCEDLIDNCAVYGESYICHGDYIPWAEINCRRFCNFCSVSKQTTVPNTKGPEEHSTSTASLRTTSVAPCVDVNKQCADYGYDYICSGDYIPWSEINCRKFCNLCQDTLEGTTTKTTYSSSKQTTAATRPPTTSTTIQTTTPATIPTTSKPPCEDTNTQCAAYGFDYICHGDYLPWSEINCRKFCNLCSVTSTTEQTNTELSTQTYISSTSLPMTTPGFSSQKPSTARSTFAPYTTTSGKHSSTLDSSQTSSTPSQSLSTASTSKQANLSDKTSIKTTHSVAAKTTQVSVQSTTRPVSTMTSTVINQHSSRSSTGTTLVNTTIRTTERTTHKSTILPSKQTKVSPTPTTEHILPTTETVTTEDLSTTEKPCKDTIDCSQYSVKLACHGEFITWAYSNCPRYCGFCSDGSEKTTPEQTTTEITTRQTTSTTTPTTTPSTTTLQTTVTIAGDPGCIDKIDCTGIQNRCGDTEEHLWLYENCRRTCNMCQETSICEDEIHECAAMAVYICDLGISPELKPKCKKTCKLC